MAADRDGKKPSLAARNKHFEAALTHMKQGLCMFDRDARLVVCNQRYYEIFDLPIDQVFFGMTQEALCKILIERGCYDGSVTIDTIRGSTQTALQAENGEPIQRRMADGRVLSILYRSIEGGGWVATFEDVTQQRLIEARLAYLAKHDPLTDLTNGRTLLEDASGLLRDLAGSDPVLVVLYIDLDRFKVVNDLHGHVSGDELLQAVARRLRNHMRNGDIISRVGADEFAVIFRALDEDGAMNAAKRLHDVLAEPYELSRLRLRITVTMGLSVYTESAPSIEVLLREADLALRAAKSSDRGAVRLFDASMSESARLRHQLEADLHKAIVEEQFEVFYQPLVDAKTLRTTEVEALVRWRHPERGLVAPGEFIGVAEEMGLIVPLGEWVMRRACFDAAAWPEHIGVAVNVASQQMGHPTFAESVLSILAQTGLAPSRLEIELTESALFVESEATLRNIGTLKETGVRFALDDFGTGYSSLSYLGRFPIGKIKIDRSFLASVDTRPDSLAIIRAVAGIGGSLGMTTLVEGVETQAQLDIARAEGIDQLQGYLFSKPVPLNEILAFFQS